jgi:DNA-binding beta-propeller fold protein YncE
MKKTLNVLFFLLITSAALGAAPSYRVIRHIPIGGEGGWDYLTSDPATHHLYVSHSTEVDVIDETSGGHIGTITGLSGVHGIALAPELNRGFISNGRSSMVTVFDLKTLKSIGEWKATGDNPDAILYVANRVFTFNGRGKNSTVFDATSGNVVATIALDGKPEFPQTDGKRVYVNIEDKGEISAIDLKTLAVAETWKVDHCEEPSGLAIDVKNHRLFSTCGESKTFAVVDTETGKTLATPPIGSGVDGGAYDPEKHLAFASCGEGVMTIISGNAPYDVVATVPTQRGARTIALDPSTHHLFLPTAKYGTPAKEGARPPVVSGSFEVLEVAP